MLVAARIAGFLLLFVLVTRSLSAASSVLGGGIDAAGKCNLDASERKVMQNKVMGRKMVLEYDFTKMKTMKDCMRLGEKYTRKTRMLKSKESYRARFVAFNADYKGPRHHPPKNN